MGFGRYNGYSHLNTGWTGKFIVWVLRSPNGTEYVIGDEAVPDFKRRGDVIARIGPIAWEEGQGLEPFKERLAQDAELARKDADAERQREDLKRVIQREIESRMPAPAPTPETQLGDGK